MESEFSEAHIPAFPTVNFAQIRQEREGHISSLLEHYDPSIAHRVVGFQPPQRFDRLNLAALTIQKYWRGYQARLIYATLLCNEIEKNLDEERKKALQGFVFLDSITQEVKCSQNRIIFNGWLSVRSRAATIIQRAVRRHQLRAQEGKEMHSNTDETAQPVENKRVDTEMSDETGFQKEGNGDEYAYSRGAGTGFELGFSGGAFRPGRVKISRERIPSSNSARKESDNEEMKDSAFPSNQNQSQGRDGFGIEDEEEKGKGSADEMKTPEPQGETVGEVGVEEKGKMASFSEGLASGVLGQAGTRALTDSADSDVALLLSPISTLDHFSSNSSFGDPLCGDLDEDELILVHSHHPDQDPGVDVTAFPLYHHSFFHADYSPFDSEEELFEPRSAMSAASARLPATPNQEPEEFDLGSSSELPSYSPCHQWEFPALSRFVITPFRDLEDVRIETLQLIPFEKLLELQTILKKEVAKMNRYIDSISAQKEKLKEEGEALEIMVAQALKRVNGGGKGVAHTLP